MTGSKPALPVLADADILVKDVVSHVLDDLHGVGFIDLRWTEEIEAEYVEHRARLRAQLNGRPVGQSNSSTSGRVKFPHP